MTSYVLFAIQNTLITCNIDFLNEKKKIVSSFILFFSTYAIFDQLAFIP